MSTENPFERIPGRYGFAVERTGAQDEIRDAGSGRLSVTANVTGA